MPDPFLKAFINKCSGHAEAVFEPGEQKHDLDTEMLAHIIAEGLDGKVSIFVCPMGADDEVAFRVGIPRQLRASGKFRHWCFFAEAWSAERHGHETDVPMPVDAPNRLEVVIFVAENMAGEQLTASRQIYRFPGQPARLLPLVFSELRSNFVMEERR